jgi:hypothetical protein
MESDQYQRFLVDDPNDNSVNSSAQQVAHDRHKQKTLFDLPAQQRGNSPQFIFLSFQ